MLHIMGQGYLIKFTALHSTHSSGSFPLSSCFKQPDHRMHLFSSSLGVSPRSQVLPLKGGGLWGRRRLQLVLPMDEQLVKLKTIWNLGPSQKF